MSLSFPAYRRVATKMAVLLSENPNMPVEELARRVRRRVKTISPLMSEAQELAARAMTTDRGTHIATPESVTGETQHGLLQPPKPER